MKKFKWWEEDAPVNATGPNVVGTGDDSSTVVVRKKVKIYRKKKRKPDYEQAIKEGRYDLPHKGDDVDWPKVMKNFKSFKDFEKFVNSALISHSADERKTALSLAKKHFNEDRNYRKEYDDYHGKPEQRERNAARLRARRKMVKDGKVKKFDKKDVHHKDNNPLNNEEDNLAVTTQNWNRSEPRLRKEELDEEVSTKEFDSLKKGDTVTIKYKSAMSSGKATFKVTAKNVVGKARVEKVTLQNIKNPRGVKHFLYKRGTGVTFAQGDMGASVVSFTKEEIEESKYPKGFYTVVAIKNDKVVDQMYGVADHEVKTAIKLFQKRNRGAKISIENDKGKVVHTESINIQERELTSTELKRREEIAQDLNDADFKKRYGDRWKEVKMGVATNMAKKESINEQDPKADKLKAKELKVAKAIAQAQLAIAKEQERVQKLTDLQNKIKDQATEETTMSKKYLKTKPGSIEESVYTVWQPTTVEQTPEEEPATEEEVQPKVDGRTRQYKETLRRIKLRKERLKKEDIEEAKSDPGDKDILKLWDKWNVRADSLLGRAIKIAIQMGGDMTGAVKKIEKIKRGISKHKAVQDALQVANEQVNEGKKEEYQKFFQAALKKFGVKSPAEMDDEKKKKFFDYIEKNWTKDEQQEFSEGWGAVAKAADELMQKSKDRDEKEKYKKLASWIGKQKEEVDVSEGELPPALKKAIAAKKAKKDDEEDEDDAQTEGLSAGQKKLPPALQKAILKKQGGKKDEDEDEDKDPVGEETIYELYSVKYKFKSSSDAKAAAAFVKKHASPGKLETDISGAVVEFRVVGGMSGSGEKELNSVKAEVDQKFKGKIKDTDITESAIEDLRKIVDKKSIGKVSGVKVDLFSASAMVKVFDALNPKNQAKVEKMLKDKRGVATFQDFAFSQVK